MLDVGEDRVFQAVAGVCTTTAFSGGQVFGESGIEGNLWLLHVH